MDYSINQKVKELSLKIKTLKSPPRNQQNGISQILLSKQYSWNIKQLIVELLYYSVINDPLSPDQLDDFQKSYNAEHSLNIQSDILLKKNWISIVNQRLVISEQIRQTFYYFRQNDKNRPDFVTDNEDELYFLFKLQEELGYIEDRLPELDETTIRNIVNRHRSLYKDCPDFEGLVKEGVLHRKHEDRFYVDSHSLGFAESFKNEIVANLFHKIIEQSSEETIEADIREWVLKTINFHRTTNLTDFLGYQKTNDVLKLIVKLIEREQEFIITTPFEQVSKWYWNSNLRSLGNIQLNIYDDIKIDNSNYIQLFQSIQEIEYQNHFLTYAEDNYYDYIDYLISIVIQNDLCNEYSHEASFTNIKELIKGSLNRPYVFWKLIKSTVNTTPEILPYLLVERNLAPVVFNQLLSIEYNIDIYALAEKEEKKVYETKDLTELWLQCFELFLDNSIFMNTDDTELAESLYHIYNYMLQISFETPNSNYYTQNLRKKNILFETYKGSLNTLLTYKNARFANKTENLFEKIGIPLFTTFINKVDDLQQKHFKSWKYDFLLRIFEIINYKGVTFQEKSILDSICDIFCNDFKKTLDWDSGLFRLNEIPWYILFVHAYCNDNLDNILNVNLKRKLPEIKDDKYVYLLEHAKKTRLFLKILFTGFNQIKTKESILVNNGINVADILLEFQRQIINIVCKNLKENKDDTTYIFDYVLENHSRFDTSPFINEFAEVINYFDVTAKKKVIATFIATKQSLDKLLVLYNNLVSEGDRILLMNEIKKISAESFLTGTYWLPEIESGLIEAMNSKMLSGTAEKILNYYERQVSTKNKMYMQDKIVLVFRLKLFVAYRNNDLKGIDDLDIPKNTNYQNGNSELLNQKQFFRALVLQENRKYDDSLKVFKKLNTEEPDNIEFKLRLLILKCDIAQDLLKEDRSIAISKIQEVQNEVLKIEQTLFKQQLENSNIYVNKGLINYIKAFSFLHLKKYVDFDNLYYNSLSFVERMSIGFLEFAIERCIQGNLNNQAYELLFEAKIFHHQEQSDDAVFIKKLQKRLEEAEIKPNLKKLLYAPCKIHLSKFK